MMNEAEIEKLVEWISAGMHASELTFQLPQSRAHSRLGCVESEL